MVFENRLRYGLGNKKVDRNAASREFLKHFKLQGEHFFVSIVTSDESWTHYTPKRKDYQCSGNDPLYRQLKNSKHWIRPETIMASVFWDQKVIRLIVFLFYGEIFTARCYCETLKKLQWAIRTKKKSNADESSVYFV